LIPNRFPEPVFFRFLDDAFRIVESQEHVATTKIVRDLTEQDLLERMLERSKPGELEPALHYLLSTPFRYPPLRYGSRFGSVIEPSLFYASLDQNTCLAECAYYRFVFWFDMKSPPPNPVATQHTVFSVQLLSNLCVDLRASEYDAIRNDLRSATSYEYTQALGARLRQAGAEIVVFQSARCSGDNIAAYTQSTFNSGPKDQEQWNSELTSESVLFRGPNGLFRFQHSDFAGEDGCLLRV
jgi:RES domain-containing protein